MRSKVILVVAMAPNRNAEKNIPINQLIGNMAVRHFVPFYLGTMA